MTNEQRAKLKDVLRELVLVSWTGVAPTPKWAENMENLINFALPDEPKTVVETEEDQQCKGCKGCSKAFEEPSKETDFEQMTSDELWDTAYQKAREDLKREMNDYLNHPGLEEESAFFKELLKNV